MKQSIVVLMGALGLLACGDNSDGGGGGKGDGGSGGNSTSDGGGSVGGGGDGGSASGGGGSSGGLGTGPLTIVYGGTQVGIDMRKALEATFDGDTLTSYEASKDEGPEIGKCTATDVTSDGALFAIGRWEDGAPGGTFYAADLAFPKDGGFHYAIGKGTETLPASGTVSYKLLATTSTTVSDGSLAPGTVEGDLEVIFDGEDTKVGFAITLDLPGDATYVVSSPGGPGNPSQSENGIVPTIPGAFYGGNALDVAGDGDACNGGTCIAAVDGFFAGPNAERVAIVAHFFNGSGGAPKTVTGVLVFEKK